MVIFILMQLDEMLKKQGAKVDKVLNFAIDDAILEERITGRWLHPSSGRTYHTKFAPPKTPGVDDVRRQISFLFFGHLVCKTLFMHLRISKERQARNIGYRNKNSILMAGVMRKLNIQ